MGPFNLLLICILVMIDMISNWFVPMISLEIGQNFSKRFAVGQLEEFFVVAASISFLSAFVLYVLNHWFILTAPEGTILHQDILWVLYAVNFMWIIVAARYLLTTNFDFYHPQQSLLSKSVQSSVGFFAGMIIYVGLKPIGYSYLRNYYIQSDKCEY